MNIKFNNDDNHNIKIIYIYQRRINTINILKFLVLYYFNHFLHIINN